MIEITKKGDTRHYTGRFADVSSFVEHLMGTSKNKKNTLQWNAEGAGWCGLSSFAKPGEQVVAATIRMQSKGWPTGVALVASLNASMHTVSPVSIMRKGAWLGYGDDIDMQQVWSGNLDRAWRRTVKQPSYGPQRIRIFVDAIASGDLDAATMAIRGAAAVKLCDELSSAGYVVEVSVGWKGARSNTQYKMSCATKPFNQPVDISSLAATTSCPAFFRVLGHAFTTCDDGQHRGVSVPIITNDDIEELLGPDSGAMTFIAHQRINSIETASKWLDECLAAVEAARTGGFAEAA